jgi:hypothetical protein
MGCPVPSENPCRRKDFLSIVDLDRKIKDFFWQGGRLFQGFKKANPWVDLLPAFGYKLYLKADAAFKLR